MSRWTQPLKEFHELITPDGKKYQLHTASRHGRWVINSTGWGMPPIDWIATKAPFQHGATVRDFRLQPRTIQLLLHQSFCDRDALWAGRENLINHLRPNRTQISFLDYWLARSQYQIQESVYSTTQLVITALAEYNGLLYGATGDDGSGTGGLLLVWDGAGTWSIAAGQGYVDDGAGSVEYGTYINCLLAATMSLPKYIGVLGSGLPSNTNLGYAFPLYGTYWKAQTFTTAGAFSAEQIRLYLGRLGDVGTVTVSLRATDGSGHPTGADLATATIASDQITNNGWYTLTLSSSVALAAATKYAIVVRAPSATYPLNYLNWPTSAPQQGDYAGGNHERSSDSGVTWTTGTVAEGYCDFLFDMNQMVPVQSGTEDQTKLWAGCGADGILQSFDGQWSPTYHMALQYDIETDVLSLVEFNDELYGGTSPSGKLLHWVKATNAWEQVAAQLTAGAIYCLVVYDDGTGEAVFGGTDEATLVKWNGVDAWSEEAAQAGGTQTDIRAMVVYHGKIYGASAPDGILYEYDVAGGQWVAKTNSLGTAIYALAVHMGRIYGSGADGKLYRWNNTDDWEVICSAITIGGSAQEVRCMAKYQNRLFGGTYNGAALIEYMHEQTNLQPEGLVLRRHLSNGEIRDLVVHIGEGPQFDDQPDGWRENSFRELIRFVAYHPVMYDPTMRIQTYLIGTGDISVSENITYDGTWEEHPTLVITGPLHEPMITNEDTGDLIALTYDIPDGDTVTIDCSQLTIKDNHNQNLLGMLTPESSLATFRMEADPVVAGGVNSIAIMGHGAGANTDFEVRYYRRFVGI